MCKTQTNPKMRHTHMHAAFFMRCFWLENPELDFQEWALPGYLMWILLRFFHLKNWCWNPMCHSLVIFCVKVRYWWIIGRKWLSTTLVSVVFNPFSFFFSPDSCKLTLSGSKRWRIWLLKSKRAPQAWSNQGSLCLMADTTVAIYLSVHHTSAVACRCPDIGAAQ